MLINLSYSLTPQLPVSPYQPFRSQQPPLAQHKALHPYFLWILLFKGQVLPHLAALRLLVILKPNGLLFIPLLHFSKIAKRSNSLFYLFYPTTTRFFKTGLFHTKRFSAQYMYCNSFERFQTSHPMICDNLQEGQTARPLGLVPLCRCSFVV